MPRLAWPSWRWMTIEWHAFVGHLDGVGVAQLVRREPPPNPGVGGELAELRADGGG